MAQYIKPLDTQDGEQRYEVVMLATGKDGDVVEASNPLPVTLGSETIEITGPVTIPGTVEINNDTGNPIPVSANTSQNSNTNPIFVKGTSDTSFFAPTQTDAFGRLRVSETFTIADYTHIFGEETELETKTSGVGAALTENADRSSVSLTVGTGSGDYVIHQSKMHHHYMPGKSQLALMSFLFDTARENTVKRVGLFGEEDGVYFQQAGDGTLQFVIRSSITGSVVDATPIDQDDWNVDKCDGTGASGFNLLIDKTQLFFCDFQWLGVGRLRVGFVHDGEYIVAHEFYHSNNISTVYWHNPSLPIRCEIRNTDTAVGTASMEQICSTVMSEGGYREAGVNFSAYAESISLAKGSPATAKCLIAIKLKDTFNTFPNRTIIRLTDMNLLSNSASVVFELWRLPSASTNITSATWTSANADSTVQYATNVGTNFTTTGGERFATGFIAANNPSGKQAAGGVDISDPVGAKRSYITQNIDSDDSSVFALIARNLSSTADTTAYASIQWREVK
jgi:hypothetical protein